MSSDGGDNSKMPLKVNGGILSQKSLNNGILKPAENGGKTSGLSSANISSETQEDSG